MIERGENAPLLATKEEESNGMKVASEGYEQHDDDDVIIPDKIAFPLVVSSHLLLITSIVALVYERYDIFAVVFFVYLTSIWHWSRPRFSSLARKCDYLAVFTAIAYASYVATTLELKYTLVWFIGIGLIGIMFGTNEYLYYIQVMKSVDGSALKSSSTAENPIVGVDQLAISIDENLASEAKSNYGSDNQDNKTNSNDRNDVDIADSWATKPNTAERDWVYKRTAFVHLTCVHVFANALALTLIIGIELES